MPELLSFFRVLHETTVLTSQPFFYVAYRPSFHFCFTRTQTAQRGLLHANCVNFTLFRRSFTATSGWLIAPAALLFLSGTSHNVRCSGLQGRFYRSVYVQTKLIPIFAQCQGWACGSRVSATNSDSTYAAEKWWDKRKTLSRTSTRGFVSQPE